MPALLLFILYLVAALILTAVLFPPVFLAVDAIWEVRPDRVFYRLAMIIAILGFWPWLRLLGIDNRNALGYSLDRARFLRTFGVGLVLGVLIMAVHAALLVLLGVRVPESGALSSVDVLTFLLAGLASGVVVAFIEETFFRGAMFYHMRRNSHVLTAVIMTSLLYAAMHFTRPPITAEILVINWGTGFKMLADMLHQFEDFAAIADSFIALFAAGFFLGLVRERSGHIALCIGIHAGWVLIIRLTGEMTSVAGDSPAAFLIGSYDSIIGWAAAAVLVVVTAGYWLLGRAGNKISHTTTP
jgi:membrane protease YdiL (CAAX protease family)